MHVYKFTLLNRRLRDGAEEDDVPEQHRRREMAFRTLTGNGGVAILAREPFGEIEIYVDLDDGGLRLIVGSRACVEPMLDTHVKPNGFVYNQLNGRITCE